MNDEFFDFQVKCMLHIDDIRNIQLRFVHVSDEQVVHFPCNGCDFESQTEQCTLCKKTIDKIFFENPKFRPTYPINIFNYLE